MGNPVVHWELGSQDPQKASDFYAKVFDWKVRHMPEMNDRIVDAGGKIVVEDQIVPGMGSFALFADPDGRVMGIWKQSMG